MRLAIAGKAEKKKNFFQFRVEKFFALSGNTYRNDEGKFFPLLFLPSFFVFLLIFFDMDFSPPTTISFFNHTKTELIHFFRTFHTCSHSSSVVHGCTHFLKLFFFPTSTTRDTCSLTFDQGKNSSVKEGQTKDIHLVVKLDF